MTVVILIASSLTVITAIILLGDSGGGTKRKKTNRKRTKTKQNARFITRRDYSTRSNAVRRNRQRKGSVMAFEETFKLSKEKTK